MACVISARDAARLADQSSAPDGVKSAVSTVISASFRPGLQNSPGAGWPARQ